MTYRVDGNVSDDDDCPDWRTEFRGTKEECEAKAKNMEDSGRYSEVIVVEEMK